MARLAGRNRPKAKLTHVQRVVASHAAQTKRLELKEAVNGILEMVNQEVSCLSLEQKKSHRYFLEQIHQGGRFARGKRGVNVFNAAQHAIGLVENKSKQEGMSSSPLKICNRHLTPYEALDISQEACETIKKVVHKVQQLGGPEKAKLLNEADRELLTQRLEETRHHLNTAAHARPIGVLHDTCSIMQSIEKEVRIISHSLWDIILIFQYQLLHLNARTMAETFMFSVKGKDEHYQDGTVIMTPKAEAFFTNILKLDPEKVSRDFELYTLKNTEGAPPAI